MQMPKEGVTTYITLRDGASSVLSSIGDKTKALDKETQSLAQAYKAMEAANKPLIQRQTELKAELEKSKDAVKDATKAFHDLKDESSELTMKEAIDAQQKLKDELKTVEGQIKENQRTYDSYQDDIRKSSMGSGSSGDSSLSSLSTNLPLSSLTRYPAPYLARRRVLWLGFPVRSSAAWWAPRQG
jgi:chromosome segregation ATPase